LTTCRATVTVTRRLLRKLRVNLPSHFVSRQGVLVEFETTPSLSAAEGHSREHVLGCFHIFTRLGSASSDLRGVQFLVLPSHLAISIPLSPLPSALSFLYSPSSRRAAVVVFRLAITLAPRCDRHLHPAGISDCLARTVSLSRCSSAFTPTRPKAILMQS